MKTRPLAGLTALAAAALLTAAPAARAQPLIEHVPEDALVYLGWAGLNEQTPGYAASSLKAVLDDTQYDRVVMDLVFKMIEQEQGDERAAEVKAIINDLYPIAFGSRVAAYLQVDPDADFEATPDGFPGRAVVIFDAGDQKATLKEYLDKIDEQEVKVFEAGNLVALVAGDHEGFDLAARPAKTLADDAGFKAIAAGIVEQPVLQMYADLPDLVAVIDKAIASDDDEEMKAPYEKVVTTLKLRDLKPYAYAGGFDGKDWVEGMVIGFAGQGDHPIAKLLGAETGIGEAELKLVSRNATWARIGTFDADRGIATVRSIADGIKPGAGEELDAAFAEGKQALGVDLRAGLLAPLGEHWVLYSDPAFGTVANAYPGFVLINPLDDAPAFNEGLHALKTAISEQMEMQEAPFKVQELEVGGLTLDTVPIPMASPTWVVTDGRFVFGLAPNAVTSAVETAQGGQDAGPTLLANPAFQAAIERVGGIDREGLAMVMFADVPKSAMTMYQGYNMLMGFAQMGMAEKGGMDVDLKPLLPPLGKLLPHLRPAASVAWVDEDGYHLKSVMPFPGALLLSPDAPFSLLTAQAQAMPLTAGVMLPALGKARSTARQTQGVANARQLAMGLAVHAAEDNDQLPKSLGVLLARNYVTPEAFLAPGGEEEVEVPQLAGLTAEAADKWVAEHSAYVYLLEGKGGESNFDAEQILLVTKPAHAQNGRVAVAYADGHVETLPVEDASAAVKKQTGKTLEQFANPAAEDTGDAADEAAAAAEAEAALAELD